MTSPTASAMVLGPAAVGAWVGTEVGAAVGAAVGGVGAGVGGAVGAHTRSVVVVGLTFSTSLISQIVMAWHWRSVEPEAGLASNWLLPHAEVDAHTRSVRAVFIFDSNWPNSHTVSGLHTLSEVGVASSARYSVSEQPLGTLHTSAF